MSFLQNYKKIFFLLMIGLLWAAPALASEADLKIPDLSADQKFYLYIGIVVCLLGMVFGVFQFLKENYRLISQCWKLPE
jgi:K(+)-stimulated pyrophosphate-energized sodium pump